MAVLEAVPIHNFAACVFLLVLRPFRVGEEFSAGGVTGLVHEVGLFVTTIDTRDNGDLSTVRDD